MLIYLCASVKQIIFLGVSDVPPKKLFHEACTSIKTVYYFHRREIVVRESSGVVYCASARIAFPTGLNIAAAIVYTMYPFERRDCKDCKADIIFLEKKKITAPLHRLSPE